MIVEDDVGLQRQLRWTFSDDRVLIAGDRPMALDYLRREAPPVVTLDLGLPPEPNNPNEGLRTLREILAISPETKVVVVTGNDEREHAVRAIGLGAYDFCSKPVEAPILCMIIDRAFRLHELEAENRKLRESVGRTTVDGLITSCRQMLEVCRLVERAAPTDITVLLQGESGTGKEVLARALHKLSARASAPLVVINCAAIPENLLESELFGFEKGAFTGAIRQTPGRLELAHGGTVFLDEIGDLPKQLQVKLLRFLQERVIERVGGRRTISIDVRIVSATHQNLRQKIEAGEFREDLFYRIAQLTIEIPPLRERNDDAIALAYGFLKKFSRESKRSLRGYTGEALSAIRHYAWPGNVRELENKVKRAIIIADGSLVSAADMDLVARSEEQPLPTVEEARKEAEIAVVRRALLVANGNVSQAARFLEISRPTLYDLMKQHETALTDLSGQNSDK